MFVAREVLNVKDDADDVPVVVRVFEYIDRDSVGHVGVGVADGETEDCVAVCDGVACSDTVAV